MTYRKSVHAGPFTKSGIACLVVLAIGAVAQSAAAQGRESRGGYTGFLGAGLSGIATGELDDRLAASGYPTFGTRPGGVTVGAYRLLRSGVMLGGEWHFLPVGAEEHEGRDVGLGGGYATLGVGYAVEPSRRLRVYPRLGLGVGGMGLWTEDERGDDGDAVDFEEALADTTVAREHATLSQGSAAVDLGAGAELRLRRRGGGPLVGLRLGYVATPFDQGWTRNGRSLRGAPEATVAGPYVRLVMGWTLQR